MILKRFLSPTAYRELWYFYYHCIVYKKPHEYPAYFYNRFFIKKKIRRVSHPFDRAPDDLSYSIHLLCSHRDVDLLLWSLASWYRVTPASGKVYIHEDGSFTPEDRAVVARLLPHARIIDFAWATREAHDVWLKDFPKARALRDNYAKHVLIVKLIDQLFVSTAPKRLILDTDLLWFNEPKELLEAIQLNKASVFQYGGEMPDPFRFANGEVLDLKLQVLNSGVVIYDLKNFSLKDVEEYAAKIDPTTFRHFVEQVGYGWVLSRSGAPITMLSKEQYTVFGAVTKTITLKHFTGPRREDFWREGVSVLAPALLK